MCPLCVRCSYHISIPTTIPTSTPTHHHSPPPTIILQEAVLIEIHPHYRLDRHFRLASRMAGKIYMPMRTTQRVSCQGTSDSIPVSKGEGVGEGEGVGGVAGGGEGDGGRTSDSIPRSVSVTDRWCLGALTTNTTVPCNSPNRYRPSGRPQ